MDILSGRWVAKVSLVATGAVVLLSLAVNGASPAQAAGSSGAQLGSPEFLPSVERPIGWRGDGTGRYPAATPTTTWSRTRGGASKNVLWASRLPNKGVSMPIIVGERIFLTCEGTDLVCLDKKSGRVLWIRSSMEFEGLSAAEKDDATIAGKLTPLAVELAQANAQVVEGLASGKDAKAVVGRKQAIEKQIVELQKSIDKKKFERYWAQDMFGFAGPTPTSDGKHVCVFYTTGVTACYDLEGKRLWITRGSGGGSEHGNFASPVLCEGRVVVWANEMRAYDVATGNAAWSFKAGGHNTYGSMFRFLCGGEWVVAFQCGHFASIKDGKPLWGGSGEGLFGDSVQTPIVEGGAIIARMGYPRTNDETQSLKAFKIPAEIPGGKLTPAYSFKTQWGEGELPVDKKKSPFDRGYVASPLFVDGLIYQIAEGGGLIVNDAATGEVVYTKVLPMKPKTEYWGWAGASANPTLAGKYIYLMDNQGTTVVIAPGREYKEVARNLLEESSNGKDQEQNVSTPIFEGTRMYYRTPGYLYCIGEK
jgi:outer membrane protein assembly factor BamB